MSERPILMSAPMVRATLREIDPKGQARRVIVPQPDCLAPVEGQQWPMREIEWHADGRYDIGYQMARGDGKLFEVIRCPYGAPGDRLWVREAWQEVHPCQIDEGRFSLPGRAGIPGPPPVDYRVIYRADGGYPRLHFQDSAPSHPYRERCLPGCQRDHLHPQERWNGWTSPIHMPRWACRIVLKVTNVRVERLQAISEADAKAEGLLAQEGDGGGPGPGYKWRGIGYHGAGFGDLGPTFHTSADDGRCACKVAGPTPAQCAYRELWDSLNAKRGYGWTTNPWVWVIDFQRAEFAQGCGMKERLLRVQDLEA